MRAEPADPHDQLLLTERPVTIVTQNTTGSDSMPSPYGSNEDEEALFSDVGSDDGYARNQLASELAADGTLARVPGVAPIEEVANGIPMTLAGKAVPLALIIAGLGIGWFLARR